MSVLDELRKKAEEKKAAEQQQAVNHERLEHTYVTKLLPKMQYLYDNLNETIDYLNFLEEPLLIKEYGTRFPQFGRLMQKDYKINTDGRIGKANYDRLMQININFMCEAPGEFTYSVLKSSSEKEKDFLNERGLSFTTAPVDNNRQRFTIKRRIPVSFSIKVDYDNSKLQVIINNHENLQFFSKNFTHEQLDDEFLDSLLSYFIRKDNRFVQTELSDDHKTIIQHHVTSYQQRHNELLKEVAKEKKTNEKAQRSFSLKGIFGKR